MRAMIIISAVCFMLFACGGGTGSNNNVNGGSPLPLQQYMTVDLQTGRITIIGDPSIGAPSASTLVFRSIPIGALQTDDGNLVYNSQMFWIMTHEVTREQWNFIALHVDQNPWNDLQPAVFRGPSGLSNTTAAHGLSYEAISAALVNANAGRTAYQLRLPTAMEWEWACRSQSTATYAWGDQVDAAFGRARVRNTVGGFLYPFPSGSLAPNAWGLYDMHGNVMEWVNDSARGPHLRGGSYFHSPPLAASSAITAYDSPAAYATAGLRLVLELPNSYAGAL